MMGFFKRFGFAAVVTTGLMAMLLLVAGKALLSAADGTGSAQHGQVAGQAPGAGKARPAAGAAARRARPRCWR